MYLQIHSFTSNFLSGSDEVIVYLLVYGLEKGNLIFQHSFDHFPLLYVNFIAKVRDDVVIDFLFTLYMVMTVIVR